MSNLNKAQLQQQYEGTRLAAAAYAAADIKALLATNPSAHQLSAGLHSALIKQGFTIEQASSFVDKYTPTAALDQDGAGAVLFRVKSTNEIATAVRGTEKDYNFINDVVYADAGRIAQNHLPVYQTTLVANFILRESTAAGQPVPQFAVQGTGSNAVDALMGTLATGLGAAVPPLKAAGEILGVTTPALIQTGTALGTGRAVGVCVDAAGHSEGSPEVTTIGSALAQCLRITTVNGPGVSLAQMQSMADQLTSATGRPAQDLRAQSQLNVGTTGLSTIDGLNGGLPGQNTTLTIPTSFGGLVGSHSSIVAMNAAEAAFLRGDINDRLAPAGSVAMEAPQASYSNEGRAYMNAGDAAAASATSQPPFTPLPSTGVEGNSHTIQSGDSLWKIGKSLGLSNSETAKFVSDIQEDYKAQGLGGNADDLKPGNTLRLPEWVKERLDAQQADPSNPSSTNAVNGSDLQSDQYKAGNAGTPATPADPTAFEDALLDAFEGADASAAAIKDKYGPGVKVAAVGGGIPIGDGTAAGYADSSSAGYDNTPITKDYSENFQQSTQAIALSNTLVGLQHWNSMSDLQRLSALTSLYNVADKMSEGALPGDLGLASSALSLASSVQNGHAIGILTSGISFGDALLGDGGASKAVGEMLGIEAGAVLPGLNLALSLENGNVGGALVSGISLANALGEEIASKAIAQALGTNAANIVPGLNLVLALEGGNPTSMLAAAASFIPGYGPLISMGISLLGGGLLGASTPPPPRGEVHFEWMAGTDGQVSILTDVNVTGGATGACQVAGSLLNNLRQMIDAANEQTLRDHPDTDPSQLLALNPNMLPSVHYDKDQISLKLPNPDGTTSFFVNLADDDAMTRVLSLLQDNGGIAPQWLVDTQYERFENLVHSGADAQTIQREVTAGKSGLTEQAWSQAAAILGSAGEAADFQTQQFGSLVVHAKDAQVRLSETLKNIDHDAYLEQTQWLDTHDSQGNAQGMLIIDFNADGVVDTRDVLNLGGNHGQTGARDAQMLNDYADLQRNNVQWLDANGDGVLDAKDPAFAAVRLYMDINQDGRPAGDTQGMAQAGIAAIDFTRGEIRYADGRTDALTAQALAGDTSGVKLTKVYEVVDGQHVDLQAGDVLENEGYQGQDASGAIRQQTFAHEAVRTGDWEGTAEQDAHRHGGTNVDDAPTQTMASGAESQGEFVKQAQAASQRTVTASQVRQTQTSERLAFVPAAALSGTGVSGLPETRLVTADMVQSMQDGLLGGGGLNLGLLAVLAAGATQAAAQAAEAQGLTPVISTTGALSGNDVSAGAVPASDAGLTPSNTSNSNTDVVGTTPAQSPALFTSVGPVLTAVATPVIEAPAAVSTESSGASGTSVAAPPAQPPLWQATVTSAPLAASAAGNAPDTQTPAPADVLPTDTAPASVQDTPAAMMLDYPVVLGEVVSGNEDVIFRIPGALLVSNDRAVNAPANPSAPALTVTAVGNALHGQVTMVNGEVVFVPEANYFGTASFVYAATDQYGLSRTATAVLQIAAVNDAPTVTGGEEIDSDEDQAVIIQAAGLLQNDVDVDSPHGELVLSRVQSGTGGTVSLNASGDVVFTPHQDFFGNAAFTYWVRDGAGAESSPVTATVVVAPINDAPGAQGETLAGASEDAVFTIPRTTLLANDLDVDDPNSALRVNWVGNASNGTVALDADGNVVFTPQANFNGYASFSYSVRDAAGLVSPAVVATIPVAAVNDAPLGVDDQFATYRDSTMSINFTQLTGNDSDVESDALTVSAVRERANGQVSIVNGKVQFVPTAGYAGAASFDYLADDGHGGQTWATAYVNVVVPPKYPTVNVTLGSSWVEVYHGDAANLRQTFNYSFDDENPSTVSMVIQPNFGAGFTYAGFGDVRWVSATDFNIFKYDVYGNANISLNLKLTDESGLTNTAHVYVRYSSLPNGVSQFQVWHDYTGYATPVFLDLDGQGFQAVATKDSKVAFDVDADGIEDRMAWAGSGNGLLTLDLDGDGKVSSAREFAFKQYVADAQTDLEGLAAFDSNQDGILDQTDAQFAHFAVWQDRDGNGLQDVGEYKTLAQLDIASITLRSNGQAESFGDVVSFGQAQFTRTDGSSGTAYDAMLAYQSGVDRAIEIAATAGAKDVTTMVAATPDKEAVAPNSADALNASAVQMALLFNQLCNTAAANDIAPLGFVPIEADASVQNWDEIVRTQSAQLQAA